MSGIASERSGLGGVGLEAGGGVALARSRVACRRVVRERARNFYYGLRLTPEPKRSAVYAVYAWMRAADDIADAGLDGRGVAAGAAARRAELGRFGALTERAFDAAAGAGAAGTGERGWACWSAFVDAVRTYGLEREDFEAVLSALTVDIETDGVEANGSPRVMFGTMEALRSYCAGVASAVGVICVRIWGWRSGVAWEEVRALAAERGLAFQLTNVLRDVAEDAAGGRCYVPAEVLASHGVTPEALAAWSMPSACEAAVRELAAEAASVYAASDRLDRLVDRDGLATLWAMTRIYRGVLSRVEREPSVVSRTNGARLGGAAKAGIALAAVARSAAGVR